MEPILDFAALIKSKKSPYPVNILSVVPNNAQAEKNLKDAQQRLDTMAKYASGAEMEVEMLTKVDFNIANGISDMSRETLADAIIMGWPSATSFLDKIIGEKAESILSRTDVNLFMCRLDKPFYSHKSITIFVPPLAELEIGFAYWMEKMLKLAQELTIPVIFICNKRTEVAIHDMIVALKSSVPVTFTNYEGWDNTAGFKSLPDADTLLVFVSARYGEVSYRDSLDDLGKRVGRYYEERNLILIYPSRRENRHIDEYEDVKTAPIFRKISREIENMFNKEK